MHIHDFSCYRYHFYISFSQANYAVSRPLPDLNPATNLPTWILSWKLDAPVHTSSSTSASHIYWPILKNKNKKYRVQLANYRPGTITPSFSIRNMLALVNSYRLRHPQTPLSGFDHWEVIPKSSVKQRRLSRNKGCPSKQWKTSLNYFKEKLVWKHCWPHSALIGPF